MYRVGVVRGGPSDEFEVSMKTGQGVLRALETSRLYAPVDLVVTKQGEWLKDGRVWDPAQLLQSVDVVFIALHGTYGEDGALQRFLETLRIPYTGSAPLPSAMAMNKAITKNHIKDTGILMAEHMYAHRDEIRNPYTYATTVINLMRGPYVVKPAASGSSVGVSMVEGEMALGMAIEKLLEQHDKVLIERRLRGREATVGIIDNFRSKSRYALPAVEIIPPNDFFNYEAKYSGTTQEICPSCFSHSVKRALEEAAALVHEALGLQQYSRSDFMVIDDEVYFMEVNTLPGLTEESLFTKALDAVGVPYRDFVEHLLTETIRQAPQR